MTFLSGQFQERPLASLAGWVWSFLALWLPAPQVRGPRGHSAAAEATRPTQGRCGPGQSGGPVCTSLGPLRGAQAPSICLLASGSPHANPEGPGSPTPTPAQTPRPPAGLALAPPGTAFLWRPVDGLLLPRPARRSGRTVSAGGGEDRLKDQRSPSWARGFGQSPGQHPVPTSLGRADHPPLGPHHCGPGPRACLPSAERGPRVPPEPRLPPGQPSC